MLTRRFGEAVHYACELHVAQVRKGTGVPYVAHLFSVAALALEHGASEDEAIAALLHDAVEDQGGAPTLAEIRTRFGATVADVVAGCSDTDVVPKPPWRARKEAYVAHVKHAAPGVKLVSACDKLHNARSIASDRREIGEAIWDRFSGGKAGSLWYYRALVEAYRGGVPGALLRELDGVVAELERG